MSATSPEGADAYARAGVDYATLDAAKRRALAVALSTTSYAASRGAELDDASRGEPATVLRIGPLRLGFVLECLGTKSLLAARYEAETGVDCFDACAYDTVAAVVNDLCCVGALPVVVNAYFATGSAEFYSGTRHASLVEGWRRACHDAGAAWGGGESPTLSGLVAPDGIDLAGSAIGVVPESIEPWLGAALEAGDEIVLVASTGLHANGASLARQVADGLEAGLRHVLANGRSFGEAVLDPSASYVGLVDSCIEARLPVHYASHITGHGLRKLMRADRALTYRVEALPVVPDVLAFLARRAGLTPREAYATLNMGAGFALFVAAGAGSDAVELARRAGHEALVAGSVEDGPRRVLLGPIDAEYDAGELELR